jgi:hypothetical protein
MSGLVRHRAAALFGALAILIALVACSGAALPSSKVGAPVAGNQGGGPAASAAAAASGSGSNAGVPTAQQQDQQAPVGDTAYIVKTGTMTVEVPRLDEALLRARAAMIGLGGYIADSQQVNNDQRSTASITFRVPVARWEDALDAIRKLDSVKLKDLKTNSIEVTGQVLDLGARIDNLKATERQLQVIMGKAVKIADILEVQSKLTEVQGQIEQLSTQQAHLQQQAALSTLTVVFSTPAPQAVSETSKGWDPAMELDHASAQLLGIGQSLATAAIWFAIVWLPVLLALGVLLLIFRFVVGRLGLFRRPDGGPGPEPALPAA